MPSVSNELLFFWAKGITAQTRTFVVSKLGVAQDLTGKTVTLKAWPVADDTTIKINGSAVLVDPDQVTNKGYCSYTPAPGDVDTYGVFKFRLYVNSEPQEMYLYKVGDEKDLPIKRR